MRSAFISLLTLVTVLPVLAQPDRIISEDPAPEHRWILGIDLAKTIIPAVSGRGNNYPFKKGVFYTIEPILRIQLTESRFYWVIQPGLTRFTAAPFGNALLNMTGGFIKVGAEYRIAPLDAVALLLTTSVWKTNGTITIPSSAFSPYVAPIPPTIGFAGGLEFQSSRDIRMGPTSLFRFVLRINGFWRSRATNSPNTPYIPGLGRYGDLRESNMSATFGASLEYHYYLRGRW